MTEETDNTGKTEKSLGAGPVKNVPDGGVDGETKQPKEHTGKQTEMGGSTGGTTGLADKGKGNDNTGSAG